MSNATQPSHNSGESRRRRSRGGKNNRNQENRRDGRGSRDNRHHQSARSEEFRPQGPRPPRGKPPVKLSWWQKLLQAIGLYKAPVKPARPERKAQDEARAPKSNTRNARTGPPRDASEPAASGGRSPKREGRGDRNRGGERPRGGDRSTVESPRVYVGNLSYDVTEQDLQELFKGVGPVRNVEIVYNRNTHRSKGYGFVEMLHMDEAIRAVEVLNDQHFMGRKMTVSGAKSKGQDEREDQEERSQRETRPVVLAPIPAAEAPATEAPATEAPATEAPAAEAPAAEAPAAEAPAAEAPAAEESEPVIQTIIEQTTSAAVPVVEVVESLVEEPVTPAATAPEITAPEAAEKPVVTTTPA